MDLGSYTYSHLHVSCTLKDEFWFFGFALLFVLGFVFLSLGVAQRSFTPAAGISHCTCSTYASGFILRQNKCHYSVKVQQYFQH